MLMNINSLIDSIVLFNKRYIMKKNAVRRVMLYNKKGKNDINWLDKGRIL